MSKYRNKNLSIQERAKIVDTERKITKIISLSMACIFILCTLIFVVSLMYSKFGGFTVAINKWQYYDYALSLSETKDFKNPTSQLNCKASEILTNISGKDLEGKNLGALDGNDSGENYLCYSFYLRNASEGEAQAVSFNYSIFIDEMTMNIENAVRIRVITSLNGGVSTKTDYAKISLTLKDEYGNPTKEEDFCDKAFRSKNNVCDVEVANFKKGDVMRFTVVIWLEGDDPECLDDIIGGEFTIGMRFKINETPKA